MRLVSTVLFLALTGTIAAADDAKPADPQPAPAAAPAATKTKVPLRVVRMLPETHQALLFDRTRGTYLLADVGKSVGGYTVEDIDDDEVTLVGENGAEIVLVGTTADLTPHHDAPDAKPATPVTKAAKPADPAPVDPYADPSPAVEATHVIEAGEAPAPAPTATVTTTVVATPAPAVTIAPPTIAPPTPVVTTSLVPPVDPDAPLVLARAEVASSLSNFSRLASSVRGAFTPAGVRLDNIAPGSLFAKAGLRAGDLITAVDNQPLHSIDDAADLYARAAGARSLTIQLTRATKPLTVHILIQ